MITVAALRGYLLEEVLARLLYDSGYRLLVSERQDPDALVRGKHGLLVRGRGADHQADVLGELMLPTPFSLPLRIFVEAKFRERDRGSLLDVRNAHGVLHDVNEHYSSEGVRDIPLRRHHYRYALFSTSGFTRPAQRYALAQQISLVDLSGADFGELRRAVTALAGDVRRLAGEADVRSFPLGQLRTAARLVLGTWTADDDLLRRGADQGAPRVEELARLAAQITPAIEERDMLPSGGLGAVLASLAAVANQNLVLGFPAAPFVLVLRPSDPAALSRYVDRHGSDVRVDIRFASRRTVAGDWVIVPADGSRAFQLRFALPDLLAEWLLSEDGAAAQRGRDAKAGLLSSIAVFQRGRLVRLLFEPPSRR
ncbi:hypothetical protein [Kutzneria sp. NPDC051319]|uniref:hypothetical protein n=1 Tax=Kutzneria sp. NPDC051319 TaxID=3155047 RepID=UPI003445C2EA